MDKQISRQRRWQLKKKALGLCTQCGKRPKMELGVFCEECAPKILEYRRKCFLVKRRTEQGIPLDAPLSKRGRPRKFPDYVA